MTDPRKFKAPFNPRERIWQEADKLRAAHPAGGSLPVQILDLAEFDLGLDLVPVDGLREQLDIDALLMGDLRSILLDKRAFMSPRLEYRLRFSVAHEIGHLILHRDIYAGLHHTTARNGSTTSPPFPTSNMAGSNGRPRKPPVTPTGWPPTKRRSTTSPRASPRNSVFQLK